MTDTFVANAARAAFDILNGGQRVVTCVEIAKVMGYEGSPVLVNAIRGDLPVIRTILRNSDSMLVMLVNETFFDRGYNVRAPSSLKEARLCLPGGPGNTTYGIKVCGGPKDMVWNAMKIRHGRTGVTWIDHAVQDAPKSIAADQFLKLTRPAVTRMLESSEAGHKAVDRVRRSLEKRLAELEK